MFFPEGGIRVHLYGQPADMRRSFDGLQVLVKQGLGRDPSDGSLYVFVNRRATQMRVLYFDRSGFCVWAKRLERGKYKWPSRDAVSIELTEQELHLLLDGVDFTRIRRLPPFSLHTPSS